MKAFNVPVAPWQCPELNQGASSVVRCREAAIAAFSSPLLDAGIHNATGIVLNITGPPDMTLFEVNEASEIVYEQVDPDVNLIFGAVVVRVYSVLYRART